MKGQNHEKAIKKQQNALREKARATRRQKV
jgi:hypothetical protein